MESWEHRERNNGRRGTERERERKQYNEKEEGEKQTDRNDKVLSLCGRKTTKENSRICTLESGIECKTVCSRV